MTVEPIVQESHPPMERSRPRSPAARLNVTAVYWMVGLVLLLPLWIGNHFPTEDGPAHLYWIRVYRELGQPNSPWAPYYERSMVWNLPQMIYFGIHSVLTLAVEDHTAQRLTLTLLIIFWLAASQYLATALRGGLTVGAFAALLLLHSSWLYVGYTSFLTGIPILLLTLGMLALLLEDWERGADVSPSRLICLGALGVLSYYAHLVAAGAYLVFVGVATMLVLRRFRNKALVVLGIATPTAALVLYYLASNPFGGGKLDYAGPIRALQLFAGLAFWRGFGAPREPDFWASLLAALVLFGSLSLGVLRGFVRRELSTKLVFIVSIGLTLAVLYFISPSWLGQTGDLPRRLQLIMWAAILPALPYNMSSRGRRVSVAVVLALLSWQVVTFSMRIVRFNRDYDKLLAGATTLPQGTVLKAVVHYEETTYEGSFAHVLAHMPEDVAYHCDCVLVQGFHPGLPFYWVRVRPTRPARLMGIELVNHSSARPRSSSSASDGNRQRLGFRVYPLK